MKIFLSTLPVWGATRCGDGRNEEPRYFNPRSPCGERLANVLPVLLSAYFNPRSPCGERRYAARKAATSAEFQSTLPVWGATTVLNAYGIAAEFQSTLPVWGATRIDPNSRNWLYDFNPRSPCGERLLVVHKRWDRPNISIHAPRVGSDLFMPATSAAAALVQSTLPVWGATGRANGRRDHPTISIHAPRVGSDAARMILDLSDGISIHAPRVGSDSNRNDFRPRERHFNPRSPCGERLVMDSDAYAKEIFQSTLPVWGATPPIRAPPQRSADFNPRSPCGERQDLSVAGKRAGLFQSTLPVWGATSACCMCSALS